MTFTDNFTGRTEITIVKSLLAGNAWHRQDMDLKPEKPFLPHSEALLLLRNLL
jgi:hypothetical protein